jgi:enoyl-CoA hydratase/carnithine racemase
MDPEQSEIADYLRHAWLRDREGPQHLLHIWHLSKPVIAAVHGWVMGGGLWYALACDITLAADNAVFGQPEVRHISNTTFLFAALAGWKAAHRYALTGDHFDAAEAYRLGLVNEVVPAERLAARVDELAGQLAALSPTALAATKRWAWTIAEMGRLLDQGRDLSALLALTDEARAGMRAFFERVARRAAPSDA